MASAHVISQNQGPLGQPDIGYAPDLDKYLARVQRRLKEESLEKTLPEGFPEKLHSDLVWDGKDLAEKYDWTHTLSPEEVEEVDNALKHFQSLNKSLGYIDQENFPLPKLHETLRQISWEIHNGHGFKVLRGIPVPKYTREENFIIYAGLSSHVAHVRGRQDHVYDDKPADVVLNHIKDLTREIDISKIGAPAYTTDKQVFHTDNGDIIALFCLQTAVEGGQSKLSSSWHVYNTIAATRPDLIRTLAGDWATEESFTTKTKPYTLRPLLHFQPATDTTPQRLIIQYARRTFTGYGGLPRSKDVPAITEAQAEALDTLHFLAEKTAVTLDFQQGDIQFANNLSIFHARDAFTDSADHQRHLVRLWLRDPEHAWKTPTALNDRWEKVYANIKAENQVFPLEPRVRTHAAGLAVAKAAEAAAAAAAAK